MVSSKYVIISPCRNEEYFMRNTLDSVIAQSKLPSLWVIVDDGSSDSSPEILDEYARKYAFIRVVRKRNRGHRSVGPGVVEAFYEGLNTIDLNKYDFLCKLDLDLILPPLYFQVLMEKMSENPRLGNCSGKPYFIDKSTGSLISEGCGDENAIGASKFYRRKCFEEIGGFVQQVMWDGIDGHRCRQLGWIAASWDMPEIRFTHLRPMGSSQKSIISGRVRHGFGQYFMGTSFTYMLASAVYRMIRRPYMIGGLAMMWGYLGSWIKGVSRLEDKELSAFIRKYQWACLLKGKKVATNELNMLQESVWAERNL
ncbi:MAG: glycosyltransferase family 2 protein [Candidatus Sedimenticola sp. (ex Thyasira tokunagai)]